MGSVTIAIRGILVVVAIEADVGHLAIDPLRRVQIAIGVDPAIYHSHANALPLQPRAAVVRVVPDLIGIYRVVINVL